MAEKILDLETEKSVKELKQLLEVEMKQLKKTNLQQWSEWKIKTQWEKNVLLIRAETFNIKGKIELLPKKVVAFLEVPFYFYPFKNRYLQMVEPMVRQALRKEKVRTDAIH